MLFPIVETTREILDALETHRGCFIYHPDFVDEGKQTFLDSTRVFDAGELAELDEKTMFPTKIASLPGQERQVIQQYINTIPYAPVSKDVDLMNDIRELTWYCNIMTDNLLVGAQDRYNWSDELYSNIIDQSEWTLNIARYPFVENKSGQILFPAHKDWGLLAIYPYVHGSGLEVYTDEWHWLEIPAGCAFCYAGDIFARITNDRVQPLLHRVSQPSDQKGSRTSIIFYADPIRDMILPDGKKVGDIIDNKLKKIGQIK